MELQFENGELQRVSQADTIYHDKIDHFPPTRWTCGAYTRQFPKSALLAGDLLSWRIERAA